MIRYLDDGWKVGAVKSNCGRAASTWKTRVRGRQAVRRNGNEFKATFGSYEYTIRQKP